MVSESFTMSKLIQRCKALVVKNGDNLGKADMLILAANSAIANFFDQSSS